MPRFLLIIFHFCLPLRSQTLAGVERGEPDIEILAERGAGPVLCLHQAQADLHMQMRVQMVTFTEPCNANLPFGAQCW